MFNPFPHALSGRSLLMIPYRILHKDCLPLALPLFIHLPNLKERFFKGRVYRGVHMTYEVLLVYQMAMETPGTVLQTRSFSSTSINRCVAEHFAHLEKISNDKPCLSEYEDENEVLILPWTLFEVKHIRNATDEDDLFTIYLTNIIITKKNLLSTFKWSWVEFKKGIIKEKKLKFDCAFQKHKTSMSKN
ncbi:unnamed protein product [Rotaria sp. Silwood1]|nr:unnamed protein product [Rotaria sp. Silwood1]